MSVVQKKKRIAKVLTKLRDKGTLLQARVSELTTENDALRSADDSLVAGGGGTEGGGQREGGSELTTENDALRLADDSLVTGRGAEDDI